MEFSNQTVIVTGAAGNLGRAVASAFADGDTNVVLVDRHRERLAERYGPETARTLYVAADLARPADTAGVATRARAIRADRRAVQHRGHVQDGRARARNP